MLEKTAFHDKWMGRQKSEHQKLLHQAAGRKPQVAMSYTLTIRIYFKAVTFIVFSC